MLSVDVGGLIAKFSAIRFIDDKSCDVWKWSGYIGI